MKNLAAFLLLILVGFSSCRFISGKRVRGNGTVITQDRTPGDFRGVRSKGSFDIYLATGPVASVRLEGESNILEYIETEIEGNALVIETRDGFNLSPKRDVKIYVTAPSFSQVKVYGSGDIVSQNKLTASEAMDFGTYGSGDIKVEVDAPRLQAEISGSGDMDLKGEVREFDGEINGSGNIKAMDLKAEQAKIGINGSGNVDSYASVKMEIQVRGSGDVRYKGPAQVVSDIKGSGSVRKVD
jgi:hypothetical protein